MSTLLKVSQKDMRLQKVRVYVRDGFIDRYSGEQLIYPGALLVLCQLRPDLFQQSSACDGNPRCKMMDKLTPTIDRIVPLHLGGKDVPDNWITTSVQRYAMRGIRQPAELGWKLYPEGNMNKWDGLMRWFLELMESDNDRGINREDPDLMPWYHAARSSVWIY